MTVINDIDDDSATLIIRVSDRRDFTPQGVFSCGNATDQNGRARLYRQRCHQDSPLQRTDSSVGVKSSQHVRRHSLNRSLRMRLVRQSATMQLLSIHLTMSGWSDPIFLATLHQE